MFGWAEMSSAGEKAENNSKMQNNHRPPALAGQPNGLKGNLDIQRLWFPLKSNPGGSAHQAVNKLDYNAFHGWVKAILKLCLKPKLMPW